MTTNKPEVFTFNSLSEECVRLSDYERLQAEHERLQAECEKLRKVADQYRRLIELGEDFQWENIIRVEISDFPSRAAAIDAAMQEPNP